MQNDVEKNNVDLRQRYNSGKERAAAPLLVRKRAQGKLQIILHIGGLNLYLGDDGIFFVAGIAVLSVLSITFVLYITLFLD
jgi:hypothetical protein